MEGKYAAISATPTETPAVTAGFQGQMPKIALTITRERANDIGTPAAIPSNTSRIPCQTTRLRMSSGAAPSAMRSPISLVRCCRILGDSSQKQINSPAPTPACRKDTPATSGRSAIAYTLTQLRYDRYKMPLACSNAWGSPQREFRPHSYIAFHKCVLCDVINSLFLTGLI